MKYKFLIVLIAIIFMSAAGVSAADDSDNTTDTVQLEDKVYTLDENKTYYINQSTDIKGGNDTVIEGNGNYLSLNVNQPVSDGSLIIIINPIKENSTNISFCDIHFKNLNLISWHEMKFSNCIFTNTTFLSKQCDNHFINCTFTDSAATLTNFASWNVKYESDFNDCEFTASSMNVKFDYSPWHMDIIGATPFNIYNSVKISNSSFYNSNIYLPKNNISISSSRFKNSRFTGYSNSITVNSTNFTDNNLSFDYSDLIISHTNFENTDITLSESYISKGSVLNLTDSRILNSNIRTLSGFRSGNARVTLYNSAVINSVFDLENTDLNIYTSKLFISPVTLFFSNFDIENSIIYFDGNISQAIKTEAGDYQFKSNYSCLNTKFINDTGIFELKNTDIDFDNLYSLTLIAQDYYFVNDTLFVKVSDLNGKPVSGLELYLENPNNRDTLYIDSIVTDKNGIANLTLNNPGDHTINLYWLGANMYSGGQIYYGKSFDITVKPKINKIKVVKSSIYFDTYDVIKLKVKGDDFENWDVTLVITIKGKKYYEKTDSDGLAFFEVPKSVKAGKYKVEVSVKYSNITKSFKLKVKPAKTSLKLKKTVFKYKKSDYLKIKIRNDYTEKNLKGVKVKVKISGKTYKLKTDKKGLIKISTKKLSKGKHKVTVTSNNKNYSIKKKAYINVVN